MASCSSNSSDGGGKRAAALEALEAQVRASGGDTRELKAPKEAQLAAWIGERARERGIPLADGAAKELATRVGGFVREGDVDRRRPGRAGGQASSRSWLSTVPGRP